MQKTVIGGLVVVILFLAAWCIRLSNRAEELERRLETRRPATQETNDPGRFVSKGTNDPGPFVPEGTNGPGYIVPGPAKSIPTDARQLGADGTATLNFVLGAAEPEPANPAAPRSGFLGIQGEDVKGGGVRIAAVVAGSVAEQAGLRADDEILEYNGKRVTNLSELTSLVREGGEGAPVSLRLRRNGTEFYQGVQLGARK